MAAGMALVGLLGLNKWRDRAIEGVGDGAEEFGFARLNDGVEGDGLDAGGQDGLLYLRNGLREAVESSAEMSEVALDGRQPWDFRASDPA